MICIDRVREKEDKFLESIYKSDSNNLYYKSDTVDVSNNSPCVFRGITRMPTIKQCVDNNIDFYYIDTGYMGCYPVKKWQRFTKNNLQVRDHLNYKQLDFLTDVKVLKKRFKDITNIDYDNYKPKRPVEGESILIIPPSLNTIRGLKVMKHMDFDQEHYINFISKEIRKYTDKKIIVRQKPNRKERTLNGKTLSQQLKKDKVHCLVAYNSIAAFEAIQEGYPAVTLGPNCANFLADNELKNLEKPYFADDEKIREHSLYLSACQFNIDEFKNGYAIKQVEQLQHDSTYTNFKWSIK